MDILEDQHIQLTLPLNKISCQEELFKYFEKELDLKSQKIDKSCFKNIMQNLAIFESIKNRNVKEVSLSITGWKSMSRKNERLFDYFMETLKNVENERFDEIKFNFKLVE